MKLKKSSHIRKDTGYSTGSSHTSHHHKKKKHRSDRSREERRHSKREKKLKRDKEASGSSGSSRRHKKCSKEQDMSEESETDLENHPAPHIKEKYRNKRQPKNGGDDVDRKYEQDITLSMTSTSEPSSE
ncbi:hypothetical protein ABEB36_002032 [Hypothenemus hampei]|uniref:Uncharacterized protein n=1 Tax=Hypothenemus hampei TaxID=57062 RepID=A0ABD1F4C9_HYPHA